ncbi:hypothetical protein GXW82_33770 [Streptacidiphilus sp. 4-A2]|nr:hypothetical protein [Streptacidiphilus sp. 4-A2]
MQPLRFLLGLVVRDDAPVQVDQVEHRHWREDLQVVQAQALQALLEVGEVIQRAAVALVLRRRGRHQPDHRGAGTLAGDQF